MNLLPFSSTRFYHKLLSLVGCGAEIKGIFPICDKKRLDFQDLGGYRYLLLAFTINDIYFPLVHALTLPVCFFFWWIFRYSEQYRSYAHTATYSSCFLMGYWTPRCSTPYYQWYFCLNSSRSASSPPRTRKRFAHNGESVFIYRLVALRWWGPWKTFRIYERQPLEALNLHTTPSFSGRIFFAFTLHEIARCLSCLPWFSSRICGNRRSILLAITINSGSGTAGSAMIPIKNCKHMWSPFSNVNFREKGQDTSGRCIMSVRQILKFLTISWKNKFRTRKAYEYLPFWPRWVSMQSWHSGLR